MAKEKPYESKNEKKERQISELKQFGKLGEEFADTLGTYQTVDEFMKDKNLSIEDVKDYLLGKNDTFKGKEKKQLLFTLVRYGEEEFISDNLETLKLNIDEKYYLANTIARINPSAFEMYDLLKKLNLYSHQNFEIIKTLYRYHKSHFDMEILKDIKLGTQELRDLALLFCKHGDGYLFGEYIDIFEKLQGRELENIIYETLKTGMTIDGIEKNKKVMDKVNFDAVLHRLSKERDYNAIIVMIGYSDFIDYVSCIDEETTKGIIECGATDIVLKNPDKFGLKKE